MIQREFTAERINQIVNSPSVHQWITLPGQGKLDLAPIVADQRNVLLMGESGGILFHQIDHGIYEAHSQFLPEGRGPDAIKTMRQAFRWMYVRTNCMEILTRVPAHNRAARAFARRCGGVLDFVRENAWETPSGSVDVEYYGLRFADWVRTVEGFELSGEAFHALLKYGMHIAGWPEMDHPEDALHDKRVGLCFEMIAAGNVDKAIALYNAFARFSGYEQIRQISGNILDIGQNVLLKLLGGYSFEVLAPAGDSNATRH